MISCVYCSLKGESFHDIFAIHCRGRKKDVEHFHVEVWYLVVVASFSALYEKVIAHNLATVGGREL